jgi:hypothetical protein
MREYFELLGFRARDIVTGFEGVVTSICFDLYGCVQGAVTPPFDEKTGKLGEGHWFDVKRLVRLGDKEVMAAPTFETVPGGEPKPAFRSMPAR